MIWPYYGSVKCCRWCASWVGKVPFTFPWSSLLDGQVHSLWILNLNPSSSSILLSNQGSKQQKTNLFHRPVISGSNHRQHDDEELSMQVEQTNISLCSTTIPATGGASTIAWGMAISSWSYAPWHKQYDRDESMVWCCGSKIHVLGLPPSIIAQVSKACYCFLGVVWVAVVVVGICWWNSLSVWYSPLLLALSTVKSLQCDLGDLKHIV